MENKVIYKNLSFEMVKLSYFKRLVIYCGILKTSQRLLLLPTVSLNSLQILYPYTCDEEPLSGWDSGYIIKISKINIDEW